ncbi:hypothetical protein NX722_11365 [Endozoicomonas gorgoniicola]|uniref:Uncharacterized protein n=1 Tax=Endozoicomonas gorgoniicola TaxID=1234144 RepID=A0ABT3MV13_9GAMM|nr:hypothetical protein [Endozoicomonas gorgoniicola]MCW7553226.1 hypothetical protein [Endozoicomonas gorgoniicola]
MSSFPVLQAASIFISVVQAIHQEKKRQSLFIGQVLIRYICYEREAVATLFRAASQPDLAEMNRRSALLITLDMSLMIILSIKVL